MARVPPQHYQPPWSPCRRLHVVHRPSRTSPEMHRLLKHHNPLCSYQHTSEDSTCKFYSSHYLRQSHDEARLVYKRLLPLMQWMHCKTQTRHFTQTVNCETSHSNDYCPLYRHIAVYGYLVMLPELWCVHVPSKVYTMNLLSEKNNTMLINRNALKYNAVCISQLQ